MQETEVYRQNQQEASREMDKAFSNSAIKNSVARLLILDEFNELRKASIYGAPPSTHQSKSKILFEQRHLMDVPMKVMYLSQPFLSPIIKLSSYYPPVTCIMIN